MVLEMILLILCVLAVVILWVAVFDSHRFTKSYYEFCHPALKKKAHTVVISDLHNCTFGRENERLIDAIRSENPDFILVTGDILNGIPNEKIDTALSFITALASEFDVYYENGNHEQRLKLYPEKYGNLGELYFGALKECGVRLLVNESCEIEEYGIRITGLELERKYYKRFGILPMEEGYLESAIGERKSEFCDILLAHIPDYFEYYVKYGSALVLSGHVHGGIIRIPILNKGLLSPNVSFFPKYDSGRYESGNTTMIVSRGLGRHTLPFRIFNPGDLVVIDLIPCDD